MVVRILGQKDTLAYKEAEQVVKEMGLAVWDETYFFVDVAIAPLLTEKVGDEELAGPRLGTLIFHPSPLPYGVGVQTQGTDNGGHMVLGRQWTRYGRYLRTGDRADRLRPAAESVL